jgi:hypothetical protein
MIFTMIKVYTQISGRWRSSDFSMEQQINAAEAWGAQQAELSPHSCEKISREAIDSEATSLLIIHPKNRIWPVPVWRRIGHFHWDDPGSTAYRRSPHG